MEEIGKHKFVRRVCDQGVEDYPIMMAISKLLYKRDVGDVVPPGRSDTRQKRAAGHGAGNQA